MRDRLGRAHRVAGGLGPTPAASASHALASVPLFSPEFGGTLLQKRGHALDEILAEAGLALGPALQIDLLLKGIAGGLPIELANERKAARTLGQPRGQLQRFVHERRIVADAIDQA